MEVLNFSGENFLETVWANAVAFDENIDPQLQLFATTPDCKLSLI
jgi:hypothetical protein